MMHLLRRLVPRSIKTHIRDMLKTEAQGIIDANTLLAALYTPPSLTKRGAWLTWDRQGAGPTGPRLPLPPPAFRMGHAADDQSYLQAGEASANFIRSILLREAVTLLPGDSILEWGCAGGRVLRHFAAEAAYCNVWGADQHGPSMSWCKEHLSPPFKFLSCTAYPHLPFEDGTFKLVYAGSVFTHILHLMDMWLMEFRRILRPGGYALFTAHDEHTWQVLSTSETQRRFVDPAGVEDFSRNLDHELSFLYAGGQWQDVVSFLRTDWIAREWSPYLDVVSFEPRSESYQTTVVLRKPNGNASPS